MLDVAKRVVKYVKEMNERQNIFHFLELKRHSYPVLDLVDSFGNVDRAKYNRDETHINLEQKVNALCRPQNVGCKKNHCNNA